MTEHPHQTWAARISDDARTAELPFCDSHDVSMCCQQLIDIGCFDLAYGRIFEGHLNALQLIKRYGTRSQADQALKGAQTGACYGVWNSDEPGNPLRQKDNRLVGGKNFASGMGFLTHAIVTTDANDPALCQMYICDMRAQVPHMYDDRWQPLGMARTDSGTMRWAADQNIPFEPLGDAGDYQVQPFFGAGALRFVAVHAGGVLRLYNELRAHLQRTGRTEHPKQRERLASAFIYAQTGVDAVNAAARRYDEEDNNLLARVAAVRMTVADIADLQIALVRDAIGLAAMMKDHPAHEPMTDLMVYLRQPNPDGARALVGSRSPDVVK